MKKVALARTVLVGVRLRRDEMEEVVRAATAAKVAPSTFARLVLMRVVRQMTELAAPPFMT